MRRYRCEVCNWEFFESDEKQAYKKWLKHIARESHSTNVIGSLIDETL